MPNKYYTEDSNNNDMLKDKGSPPDTGPNGGQKGEQGEHVREHTETYSFAGKTQSKDRSAGIHKCKTYAQDKGL